MTDPLLEIRDLAVGFRTERGVLRAVDGISFDIAPGSTLGLVGESGCGKSVTALSIMRLVAPPGRIACGTIRYRGADLLTLPDKAMRAVRGNRIAMIFQEPMTSLNPVFTVGDQVGEAVRLHQRLGKAQARARAVELFRRVGIPSPDDRVDAYPHQLSGGMRQRVMIAMALACTPDLLIADEPTTALDVTIQAQVLDLLKSLQRELGMSILLITHDLGVVAEMCDHVIVMYAGKIVEHAPTQQLLTAPRHHYTLGLLRSRPGFRERGERLQEIPGMVPSLYEPLQGCAFADRCSAARAKCRSELPQLVSVDCASADRSPLGAGSQVRCHFPHGLADA